MPISRGRRETANDVTAQMLLVAAAALVRLDGIMGIPLSEMDPVACVAGAATAILIAVLASLPPARPSVQPMAALRSS